MVGWKYPSAFWEDYKGYIKYTWPGVFFSRLATNFGARRSVEKNRKGRKNATWYHDYPAALMEMVRRDAY